MNTVWTREGWRTARRALVMVLVGAGCSSAMPAFPSARPPGPGRVSTTLGGSARIGFGDVARLGEEGSMPPGANTTPNKTSLSTGGTHPAEGGVTPAGQVRVGLGKGLDTSLTIAGTTGRLELRHHTTLSEEGTTLVGLSSGLGAVVGSTDPDRGRLRFGGDLPLFLVASFGSVVEAHLGPRLGLEWLAEDAGSSARVFRGGVTVGLATGFLAFHALAELSAYHEWWSLSGPGGDRAVRGFALVPAFGLRWRFP
ncbi:MAG: hypothetical protein KC416_02300 [Myxococcales bacterium]|nr:hypothetical protein [Myxococcales bacterium]